MNSFLRAVPAAPRRTTPIRLGIAAALLAVVAPAQIWVRVQPAVRPTARSDHTMVFDSTRNVTLLFGGINQGDRRNDTWTWNGAWAQQQPGIVPPPRYAAGMVYDSARQRVVLFGGNGDNGTILGDTWTWDGTTWLQGAPMHAPAARWSFAMAYDSARARTVLFGGSDGNLNFFADTWTWDGTDWVQLAPAHAPQGRWTTNMVYDRARARCVLFGGGGPAWLGGDTWEWDGIDWVQRLPAHAPSPRGAMALAFDEVNQRVVLFGGIDSNSKLGDTWEYDGSDWELQTPSVAPSARVNAAMAYDATHAQVLLFGGGVNGGLGSVTTDEMWRYTRGGVAGTFTPFGQGCLGSVGVPQLALASGTPVTGTTFQVSCTTLQLDHFTTMWIGFSRTSWSLGSLPYDLAPLGMPGCTLFVSADLVTTLLNWNGTALWETAIPNSSYLVGLPFYLQAGVIDRVNTLGMVVTNAAEVRVGDH